MRGRLGDHVRGPPARTRSLLDGKAAIRQIVHIRVDDPPQVGQTWLYANLFGRGPVARPQETQATRIRWSEFSNLTRSFLDARATAAKTMPVSKSSGSRTSCPSAYANSGLWRNADAPESGRSSGRSPKTRFDPAASKNPSMVPTTVTRGEPAASSGRASEGSAPNTGHRLRNESQDSGPRKRSSGAKGSRNACREGGADASNGRHPGQNDWAGQTALYFQLFPGRLGREQSKRR